MRILFVLQIRNTSWCYDLPHLHLMILDVMRHILKTKIKFKIIVRRNI